VKKSNWEKITNVGRARGPKWLTTPCDGGEKYYLDALYGGVRNPTTTDLHSVTKGMFITAPRAMYTIRTGSGDDAIFGQIPHDRHKRGDDPYFAFLGEGDDVFVNKEGVAHVWGGPGDDTFTNSYWAGTTFDGGPGDDYLFCGSSGRGKSKNVVCIGGTGNDRLDASGTRPEVSDFLYAGQGDDWVSGGGSTFADLGTGNDKYNGELSAVVLGGDGDDVIECGGRHSQACFLAGGPGNDKMVVGSNDYGILFGGPGNDDLKGSRQPDLLAGGDGHDIIRPGSSHGRMGADVIVLEPGTDNVDRVILDAYYWAKTKSKADQKLKFDVSEFGFKDFQEVQSAGFSAAVVTDTLVTFRLDVGSRHVIVKMEAPKGGRWGFKAADLSGENFIYAKAPAQMLETDLDITAASSGPSCR